MTRDLRHSKGQNYAPRGDIYVHAIMLKKSMGVLICAFVGTFASFLINHYSPLSRKNNIDKGGFFGWFHRQWPINLCTSPMMTINKITPSVDFNQWFNSLDTQPSEPTYQNSMNTPKVVKPTNKIYEFLFFNEMY